MLDAPHAQATTGVARPLSGCIEGRRALVEPLAGGVARSHVMRITWEEAGTRGRGDARLRLRDGGNHPRETRLRIYIAR